MIQILPVQSKKDFKKFLHFPWQIYKNDPVWVPPLLVEEKKKFFQKTNPFFEHGQAQLFLATKNARIVGRISAHIDLLHNKTHNEKTGFFGFFECINDVVVSRALLDTAAQWLKNKGMDKIRGPFNFSINDETGFLVKGFEYGPFILTPHNPAYYPELVVESGFSKIKDLFCWKYDSKRPVPEVSQQIADVVHAYPGLVVRHVDMKNMERDVRIIIDVFNSAWSKNWGFVPLTESEIKKAVQDFKMILEPSIALIAEVNGVPAAISLAIPNMNEAIKDLNGRLFPFGIFKLLYRLKMKKIYSSRLVLLGIKKEFRSDVLGALSVLLYTEMHKSSQKLKHWGGELGWTLEDNEKINRGIAMMGGDCYKIYRVYEKKL
ncbi:MAG TPA: N-acetyltransferase [Deltaproteobacteria bacterium]|nr:MAG: hypothetical protein A2048_00370 [Deltaproteobacteria bacterium GWA2_45_12]HBF11841.1 N-acetyltransferase [Deltaproteobacteria bacterium]